MYNLYIFWYISLDNDFKGSVKWKKRGGVSGINRWAIYSSAFPQIFYFCLKDPGPLNNKKRISAAEQLSMLLDWIKVFPLQKNTIAGGSLPAFFSIAVVTSSDRGQFLCGFSLNFSWIFYRKINIVINTVKTGTLHVSLRTIHRFNALLVSSIAEHSDGFLLL